MSIFIISEEISHFFMKTTKFEKYIRFSICKFRNRKKISAFLVFLNEMTKSEEK